jgi:hypothetical protein
LGDIQGVEAVRGGEKRDDMGRPRQHERQTATADRQQPTAAITITDLPKDTVMQRGEKKRRLERRKKGGG